MKDTSQMRQLCRLNFHVEGFRDTWGHCDQLANYLSRAISFGRPDPFTFANLISAVLNEVFEIIYCHSKPDGFVAMGIYDDGGELLLDAIIPAGDQEQAFYSETVSDVTSGNASKRFLELLNDSESLTREIGFYELAADYAAKLDFEVTADGDAHLQISASMLQFEGVAQ